MDYLHRPTTALLLRQSELHGSVRNYYASNYSSLNTYVYDYLYGYSNDFFPLSLPYLSSVRIVLLVRDPRGTMQSRRHRVWCAGNEDCEDPRLVCQDLQDDYKTAKEMLEKYPSRFR